MIRVGILTVSDSCARGARKDVSGQAVRDALQKAGFEICEERIVADDRDDIAGMLRYFSDECKVDVVITTGGTGLGPRDVTPEATELVCEKVIPGLSEIMRAKGFDKTENAVLSRGVSGIRNKTLIINLPGGPPGVRESLEVIVGVLPHAVEMMLGGGH
jgi:molybdopterin adenylyltransferase